MTREEKTKHIASLPWDSIQNDVTDFARDRFGHNGVGGPMQKLPEEIKELMEDPFDPFEYADCFLILMHMAKEAGVSMAEIKEACYEKHYEINMERTWELDPETNTYKHKKT